MRCICFCKHRDWLNNESNIGKIVQNKNTHRPTCEFLEAVLAGPPPDFHCWPDPAITLDREPLHRHLFWEIGFLAETPIVLLIPPGVEHGCFWKTRLRFALQAREFRWNMPPLGRFVVPDPQSPCVRTIFSILENCRIAMSTPDAPPPGVADGLSLALLSALLHFWRTAPDGVQNFTQIVAAAHYLDGHFAKPGLSLREVADHACFSLRLLHYQFRSRYGMTPGEYLLRLRMTRAAELLGQPTCTVAQAALCCGIPDRSYFGKQFVRCFGVTPAGFRKNHLAGNPDPPFRFPKRGAGSPAPSC